MDPEQSLSIVAAKVISGNDHTSQIRQPFGGLSAGISNWVPQATQMRRSSESVMLKKSKGYVHK